jgi:hypothetical protein
MKWREVIVGAVLGLALGTGLTLVLNGFSIPSLGRSVGADGVSATGHTAESLNTPSGHDAAIPDATSSTLTPTSRLVESAPTPVSMFSPSATSPTATPSLIPLIVGAPKGENLEDVLLLYDSASIGSFDVNFCKVAEYHGLVCRKIALDTTDLTQELLQDTQGSYFKLVGISATTLLGGSSLLAENELTILQSAIEAGGVNLLVSEMREELDPAVLVRLTDGAVLGATEPLDSVRNWSVSLEAPEITREFTGQVISATSTGPQEDFALSLGQQAPVTTLVSSEDDGGTTYPIYVLLEKGAGSVFVDAGERAPSLDEMSLKAMYYSYDFHYFSSIVPLMFTVRYALGNEAWHNDHNYANLTIDDPALTEPWNNLSFVGLLREMETHNFHTTIAMHPATWSASDPVVVALFRTHPDRYSLVQHGNNGGEYEFYKYAVSEDDEYNGQKLPAKPFAEQEADIVEGLTRMAKHRASTGIPSDRVMIFPWGISPEPTLVLLKKYNYLATVNALEVPLGAARPSDWDYGMYQAVMDYGSFPSLPRWCFKTYKAFRSHLQFFVFDLFVDKPALFCTHAYEDDDFGRKGMGAFNPIADQVSAVSGGVEWHSLGYIIRHLYLEKTNDDGSVDIKMYGNHLIVANESPDETTYHVAKAEALNVPLSLLTVNGHEFPYRVEEGLLLLDVQVPANSSMEVRIQYGG